MGEMANDIINGACCALCGQYFIKRNRRGQSFGYEHGYPVACQECYEPGCGYGKTDCEVF